MWAHILYLSPQVAAGSTHLRFLTRPWLSTATSTCVVCLKGCGSGQHAVLRGQRHGGQAGNIGQDSCGMLPATAGIPMHYLLTL